jgi:hypothetical protein
MNNDDVFAGWRANPESFIECLIDPDTGKPFVLLQCERTFIANMFKFDADGKMLFPDLIYSAGKKTGKTIFGAILVITTIVLFGGRNAEGYCCGRGLPVQRLRSRMGHPDRLHPDRSHPSGQ